MCQAPFCEQNVATLQSFKNQTVKRPLRRKNSILEGRCTLSMSLFLSFKHSRAYRFASYTGVPHGPLRVIFDCVSTNRSIQWYGGRVLRYITIYYRTQKVDAMVGPSTVRLFRVFKTQIVF